MTRLVILVTLALAGCDRLDTNGYYGGPSRGPVHCSGLCGDDARVPHTAPMRPKH